MSSPDNTLSAPMATTTIPVDPSLPGEQGPAPHVLLTDRLVQRYRLTAQQKSDLSALYQVCMRGPVPLSHSDTMSRIFLLACQYGSERRIIERLNIMDHHAGGVAGTTQLQTLLGELSVRLEDSWAITAEQKKNIRRLCQEQIYLPGRTNFKTLALDVDAVIKLKPAAYRLENIVGRPHREDQLNAFVKATSSNVRNVFRQELKRSLFGKKMCAVDKFVVDQATRYNLARSNNNSQAAVIQSILLRRFAREHANLLEGGQEEEEEEDVTAQSNTEGNSQPPQKKQKRATGRGRVADGQDFWSKVDEWFDEKVAAWGDKFSGDEWSAFIDESTQQDSAFINAKKAMKPTSQAADNSWNATDSNTDPSSDSDNGGAVHSSGALAGNTFVGDDWLSGI